MVLTASLLVDCKATLGEAVHWHPGRRRVYWSDIEGRVLWSCEEDGARVRQLPLSERLCDFALADDGRFLGAFADGLGWLDPVTGERSLFEPYQPDLPQTRMNDGAVDRQGRFIVGGTDEATQAPVTPVWRVDRGKVSPILSDVAVANALAFSPDGAHMFFADTPTGMILRYAYDVLTGVPGDPVIFAESGPNDGLPDGACIDSKGALWSARFGGGAVQRYLPDGRPDLRVTVSAPNVTNCALGGRGWRKLFISTARAGMDAAALAACPEAGGLFVAEVPDAGLPEGTYRR